MEPQNKPRPVMDIQPTRSAQQPLPRTNFVGPAVASPKPPAPPPPPQPEPTPAPETKHEAKPEAIPPAKPKPPVGIIVIALLVAASFIGLTILGYVKAKDPAPTNSTSAY